MVKIFCNACMPDAVFMLVYIEVASAVKCCAYGEMFKSLSSVRSSVEFLLYEGIRCNNYFILNPNIY